MPILCRKSNNGHRFELVKMLPVDRVGILSMEVATLFNRRLGSPVYPLV
jgi:hypothetical protein